MRLLELLNVLANTFQLRASFECIGQGCGESRDYSHNRQGKQEQKQGIFVQIFPAHLAKQAAD